MTGGAGRSGSFLLPLRDLLAGLDAVLAGSAVRLAWVFAGTLAGWWLYVPIHELLHAAGCFLTGGAVTRLEIAPLYGGAILARVLPFVASGGEYAGRLSGFDTRGSDFSYLATDFAPFLLTLFPGVWALRRAARAGRPVLFGLALPLGFAPFLSLTGDAYEIGSILVTRLGPWAPLTLLRGDDSLAKARELLSAAGPREWSGFLFAQALGVAWAALMYAGGSAVAGRLGQPPLPAPAR